MSDFLAMAMKRASNTMKDEHKNEDLGVLDWAVCTNGLMCGPTNKTKEKEEEEDDANKEEVITCTGKLEWDKKTCEHLCMRAPKDKSKINIPGFDLQGDGCIPKTANGLIAIWKDLGIE